MSVGLGVLKGGSDFSDIEVMSKDYDGAKDFIWLWRADDGECRIDLSRDQCKQLLALLKEIV